MLQCVKERIHYDKAVFNPPNDLMVQHKEFTNETDLTNSLIHINPEKHMFQSLSY